jgi:integrase
METGKKRLPNGSVYRESSIQNYKHVKKKLLEFAVARNFGFRFRKIRNLSQRGMIIERNYWKKFYRKFTAYLYKHCNHKDNYVGMHMKILRAFFNYVNRDLMIDIGNFHCQFYVTKEQIPIIALTQEQLQFLIYNIEFENSLPDRLKRAKDIFVFGCSVALRYSDLMSLTESNLIRNHDNHYLSIRSKKTKVYSQIKLPDYAIAILVKYKKLGSYLLPQLSNFNLNKYLKELAEKAGWIAAIGKTREKKGKLTEVKKGNVKFRFCDHITTHTMRRTAITTMLTLGVPEYIIRSISGHAAGSKEFFRYIAIAQSHKDQELDKMYEKMKSSQQRAGENKPENSV